MDLGTLLSGPIGALVGAGGTIVGRILDYKDAGNKRAHELAMRDKDAEILKVELANRSEIAKVEADQAIALREFDATAASIAADRATYGGGWVDQVRGMVRPVITALAMGLITYLTIRALWGATLSGDDRMEIVRVSQFLAGVAITWWFGDRMRRAAK